MAMWLEMKARGYWLTSADRFLVEIAATLMARYRIDELKSGDVILAVKGEKISSQTGFYRKLWALGPAGVDVPLTVHHDGVTFEVVLSSIDRTRLFKAPRLH